MTYLDKAKQNEDYLIKMRRYFHENPELSDKEYNTLKTIKEELDKMGVEYIEIEKGGILGVIEGNLPGDRSVMLRADIDALPVKENKNNLKKKRTVISKNEGVMHACGHDGHIAMLLTAAKILVDEKDKFPGKIYLIFERGEEGTQNYTYIHAYLQKNNIVPDTVFAMHLQSMVESGLIGISDGPMMAGAQLFDITLTGTGGHGSRPDQANSPIDAFTDIYTNLQAMRLREIDPFETLTYSVGSLESGAVANVIPNDLRFSGTARFLNRAKAGVPFYENMKDIVEKTAKLHDVKVTYNAYTKPMFPVVNDKEAATFARDVIGKDVGVDRVFINDPWMASESYATYLEQWPGVFAFLGIQNKELGTGAAHHNEYFDIDEDALKYGVAGFLAYSIGYLNSDVKFEDKDYKGRVEDIYLEMGETEEDIEEYFNPK